MSTSGLIRPYHTKIAFMYKLIDATLIILMYAFVLKISGETWNEQDTVIILAAVILYYISGTANGLYSSWRISSIIYELSKIWVSWFITVLTMMFLAYSFRVLVSYHNTLLWLLITPVILSFWHLSERFLLRELRKRGHNTRNVAIIGMTDIGLGLADVVTESSWMGLVFCGFYEDRKPRNNRTKPTEKYNLEGNFERLFNDVREGRIDLVYIALPLRAEKRIRKLVSALSETTVSLYIAQDYEVFHLLQGRFFMFGKIPVVSIFETPFYGVDGWIKRIEDVLLSIIIIAVMSIPAVIISLAVKLSSKGPILYKQRRFGLNCREIMVWKFRSMVVCEGDSEVRQAEKNDSRVTRLGKFLRGTSLDEIPQFINVLQGTMSIVGPRPHAIIHNEEYKLLIGSYMLRHKVKPGITGLAQVNGWRGNTDTLEKMEKRVQFDLEYIRSWSIYLDLKIIFLTMLRGFTGDNAY